MTVSKIADLLALEANGQSLTVKGWVRTFRANRFIALNDGSSLANLQCVVAFETLDEKTLKRITTGAALALKGT
ncbi:MAG: asparagine--tRNA ligase, partial [Flavobacteriaceae bacterium]